MRKGIQREEEIENRLRENQVELERQIALQAELVKDQPIKQ
jgi:hypothetical protein